MKKFFSGLKIKKVLCLLILAGILFIANGNMAYATENGDLNGTQQEQTHVNDPGTTDADELREPNIANRVTITTEGGNGSISGSLQILITLTLIAISPILLIMLTSFTRVIIVLHFTRAALNTNTAPPNQVLIGLALFLTFFIMGPAISEINETAYTPYLDGEITQEEAIEIGMKPLREFMYAQTQTKDVQMFMEISGTTWDGEIDSIPNSILIPSFVVSELRTAFIIGFLIYIPFLVIDMVVSSVLMSMGMMMLPPTTISMPFKILLFILADGWNLIIGNLVRTFY